VRAFDVFNNPERAAWPTPRNSAHFGQLARAPQRKYACGMRRRLKNLKHKSGHSENGAPKQLIDEAVYREHWNNINVFANAGADPGDPSPHWDSGYSGWSHASRPRDQAISLRSVVLEQIG
jgi:hypothetical protein